MVPKKGHKVGGRKAGRIVGEALTTIFGSLPLAQSILPGDWKSRY